MRNISMTSRLTRCRTGIVTPGTLSVRESRIGKET